MKPAEEYLRFIYAAKDGGYTEVSTHHAVEAIEQAQREAVEEAYRWIDITSNPPKVKDKKYFIIVKDIVGEHCIIYIEDEIDVQEAISLWNEWKPLEMEDKP